MAPIVVTAGEPAGIGPELCLTLAAERPNEDVVFVADPGVLRARAATLPVLADVLAQLDGVYTP